MAEIIPAILPKSYEELEEKLDIAAGHSKSVQIDICDGAYVPNRTWPYLKGTASEADQIFESLVSQEKALPHWEEIDFEFDLMVRNVREKIPDFISAGASRIIVHRGSVDEVEMETIIKDYGKHSEEIGIFDIELGIALLPDDSPQSIKNFVSNIHFVQVMGISKVGFQGQNFDEGSLELIRAIKLTYPDLIVSVDGGVNADTAKLLVEAGADRLVVGSYLFNATDFSGTLRELGSI
jgi:ribulose-phosphate 3-epimerase